MAISLKDVNRAGLVLVVVANVVVYYALLTGLNLQNVSELLSSYESYVPGALIALLVGVLNSQLGHETKARIVFWRWSNPLPGSRAFSHIMSTDSRIDPSALEAIAGGSLPTAPTDQNRLWFKWYREFQNEPGILQVHREYLFARDWAGLAILLGLAMAPLAFWQMEAKHAWIIFAFFVIQYLLVKRSAKNHGERFVASVLANKSASA